MKDSKIYATLEDTWAKIAPISTESMKACMERLLLGLITPDLFLLAAEELLRSTCETAFLVAIAETRGVPAVTDAMLISGERRKLWEESFKQQGKEAATNGEV